MQRVSKLEHDSEKKLIESLYNVTLDPNNFQQFLDQWEAEFSPLSIDAENHKNIDITVESQKISRALESHFSRAYAILDMVELNEGQTLSLEDQIEASFLPTFLVLETGEISVANSLAGDLLGIEIKQDIKDINLRIDDLEKAKNILRNYAAIEPHKVLAVFQTLPNSDVEATIFAVSKFEYAENDKNYLRFCAVQTIWNAEIGRVIKDTFGLTNMELDIAERLVAGKKLSEIADDKNRSILTVRTQSKSLYKKTNLKSQADLIKFFTMLQNMDPLELNIDARVSEPLAKTHILKREDGRDFYYETYGHPNGEPVLFMHGIMTGTDLTSEMSDYLHAQNIKLIAPHRPGFGCSAALATANMIDFFTDDIVALLAAENIENCKILAHSSGSFYAYHLGSILPHIITKIRVISGAVPFTRAEHIRVLNPRQRIVTNTAKYTPKLLPFLLRGSEKQVKKYGAESLIDALYEDSEVDYALIKQPEIRELIIKGFEASFKQGVSSPVADGLYIFSDRWRQMVTACQMPIELFHGADNQAVPMEQVNDFFDEFDEISIEIVDGGQLIFYKFFENMLKGL